MELDTGFCLYKFILAWVVTERETPSLDGDGDDGDSGQQKDATGLCAKVAKTD